jgi:hypothetical protein
MRKIWSSGRVLWVSAYFFYASLASKRNLLNHFVFCQEFHCGSEESVFEVAKRLHLTAHVIMHWHDCQFPRHTKPANQLVTKIQ